MECVINFTVGHTQSMLLKSIVSDLWRLQLHCYFSLFSQCTPTETCLTCLLQVPLQEKEGMLQIPIVNTHPDNSTMQVFTTGQSVELSNAVIRKSFSVYASHSMLLSYFTAEVQYFFHFFSNYIVATSLTSLIVFLFQEYACWLHNTSVIFLGTIKIFILSSILCNNRACSPKLWVDFLSNFGHNSCLISGYCRFSSYCL